MNPAPIRSSAPSRTVFHLEVPDFAVTVERVRDRSLTTRPVVIAMPGNPRALVLAASGEAREAGIVTGMRLAAAERLCPTASVLAPDHLLYRRAGRAVQELLNRFTPVIEGARGGRFFLDMTGTGRLLGPPRDAAARILRETVDSLRLSAGIGIAVNKAVSQVASSIVRADLLDVFPGSEASFLSPWHIRKLPGTEKVSEPRLFEDLNIRKIGQLAGYRVAHLAAAFGRMGPVLGQRARGVDPRPVLPRRQRPVVHEEQILTEETNHRDRLLATLRTLSERCGWRLRQADVAARTVTLQVAYTDSLLREGRAAIGTTANDDEMLFGTVRTLFCRVACRRVRVRYLAVTFADLSGVVRQLDLFGGVAGRWLGNVGGGQGHDDPWQANDGRRQNETEREDVLTGAMDAIRGRFGAEAIRRGAGGDGPLLPSVNLAAERTPPES